MPFTIIGKQRLMNHTFIGASITAYPLTLALRTSVSGPNLTTPKELAWTIDTREASNTDVESVACIRDGAVGVWCLLTPDSQVMYYGSTASRSLASGTNYKLASGSVSITVNDIISDYLLAKWFQYLFNGTSMGTIPTTHVHSGNANPALNGTFYFTFFGVSQDAPLTDGSGLAEPSGAMRVKKVCNPDPEYATVYLTLSATGSSMFNVDTITGDLLILIGPTLFYPYTDWDYITDIVVFDAAAGGNILLSFPLALTYSTPATQGIVYDRNAMYIRIEM